MISILLAFFAVQFADAHADLDDKWNTMNKKKKQNLVYTFEGLAADYESNQFDDDSCKSVIEWYVSEPGSFDDPNTNGNNLGNLVLESLWKNMSKEEKQHLFDTLEKLTTVDNSDKDSDTVAFSLGEKSSEQQKQDLVETLEGLAAKFASAYLDGIDSIWTNMDKRKKLPLFDELEQLIADYKSGGLDENNCTSLVEWFTKQADAFDKLPDTTDERKEAGVRKKLNSLDNRWDRVDPVDKLNLFRKLQGLAPHYDESGKLNVHDGCIWLGAWVGTQVKKTEAATPEAPGVVDDNLMEQVDMKWEAMDKQKKQGLVYTLDGLAAAYKSMHESNQSMIEWYVSEPEAFHDLRIDAPKLRNLESLWDIMSEKKKLGLFGRLGELADDYESHMVGNESGNFDSLWETLKKKRKQDIVYTLEGLAADYTSDVLCREMNDSDIKAVLKSWQVVLQYIETTSCSDMAFMTKFDDYFLPRFGAYAYAKGNEGIAILKPGKSPKDDAASISIRKKTWTLQTKLFGGEPGDSGLLGKPTLTEFQDELRKVGKRHAKDIFGDGLSKETLSEMLAIAWEGSLHAIKFVHEEAAETWTDQLKASWMRLFDFMEKNWFAYTCCDGGDCHLTCPRFTENNTAACTDESQTVQEYDCQGARRLKERTEEFPFMKKTQS